MPAQTSGSRMSVNGVWVIEVAPHSSSTNMTRADDLADARPPQLHVERDVGGQANEHPDEIERDVQQQHRDDGL